MEGGVCHLWRCCCVATQNDTVLLQALNHAQYAYHSICRQGHGSGHIDLRSGPSNGTATQVHGGDSEVSGIKLTCWDCRALFHRPGFDEKRFEGAVISEHGSWPYKLDKLDKLDQTVRQWARLIVS